MRREIEVATYLRADEAFKALLPGGIYAWAEIEPDGIRRGEQFVANAAFNADGLLMECLLVRDRAAEPFGPVRDFDTKQVSMSQVTQLFFYFYRQNDEIEAATLMARSLMFGHPFTDAYPAMPGPQTQATPDAGPVKGSMAIRQDWQIVFIMQGEVV